MADILPNSVPHLDLDTNRRKLLQRGVAAAAVIAIGPALWGCGERGSPRAGAPLDMRRMRSAIPDLAGTLHEVAVENDPATRMLVPRGFSVRQVARTGQRPVDTAHYAWPREPDGGAVFGMPDGGWVYVCNSEVGELRQGGVGALRFDSNARILDAYSICTGTTNNCAGGPTPWGSWLTCEEFDAGLVYECDPTGNELAVPLPALGVFKHEAAAVDPNTGIIYLTEDTPDGVFYRFVPASFKPGGIPDMRSGRLEAAVVSGINPLHSRPVTWIGVPNPTPAIDLLDAKKSDTPTRSQVPEAERFNGGEGCWHHQGIIYFTTKGDNRVWALDTRADRIDLVYDKQSQAAFKPGLDDVDNVTVSSGGDILVAEDGAEMRLVVVGPDLTPFELVNVLGHRDSEITGPAFSPDGTRLYFNSQRGPAVEDEPIDGRTYEMHGPFFEPI